MPFRLFRFPPVTNVPKRLKKLGGGGKILKERNVRRGTKSSPKRCGYNALCSPKRCSYNSLQWGFLETLSGFSFVYII